MRKVICGVVCVIAAICAVLGGSKTDTNECNLNGPVFTQTLFAFLVIFTNAIMRR